MEQAASIYGQARAVTSACREHSIMCGGVGVDLQHSPPSLDDNTLLPGHCKKVDVEFYKRLALTQKAVINAPPTSACDLQLIAFGVAYDLTMFAAYGVLCQVMWMPRPPPAALAFVLRALDMVRIAHFLFFIFFCAFFCTSC